MSSPGWFQDSSGQKECNPCPPGFHCQSPGPSPTRGGSSGVSSPLPCPAGYVCPRESPDSQPLPCPKGTYSPSQGLTTAGSNPSHLLCTIGLTFKYSLGKYINVLRMMFCGANLILLYNTTTQSQIPVDCRHLAGSLSCFSYWNQSCPSLGLQVNASCVQLVSSVALKVWFSLQGHVLLAFCV